MSDVRQLALIPVRDTVLYPGSDLGLYVGREATIAAIRHAKAKQGDEIAVFTQTNGATHGPITADDIYKIGTVAKIAASVEMSDESIKIMLEGVERVQLDSISVVDGVTLVTVRSLPEAEASGTIASGEQEQINRLLGKWNTSFAQDCEQAEYQTIQKRTELGSVVKALRTILATPRIERGQHDRWLKTEPPARYTQLKNAAVAMRKRVLEEGHFDRKLVLLIEAIDFDVACRSEGLHAEFQG